MNSDSYFEIYRNAVYKISSPEILISVNKKNPVLDDLLKKENKKSWAFLTAYNPYSILVPEEQNEFNQNKLIKILLNENYILYDGIASSSDNSFPEEKSFLCIGISFERSIEIGNEFEQNAILYAEFGFEAKLIFLSEER